MGLCIIRINDEIYFVGVLNDLVGTINKPIRIGWKGLSENPSNRIYENKGCSVGRFSHYPCNHRLLDGDWKGSLWKGGLQTHQFTTDWLVGLSSNPLICLWIDYTMLWLCMLHTTTTRFTDWFSLVCSNPWFMIITTVITTTWALVNTLIFTFS